MASYESSSSSQVSSLYLNDYNQLLHDFEELHNEANKISAFQIAWQASHTTRRHAPVASSLHRHRRADSTTPPDATCRHRLAHLPAPPGASLLPAPLLFHSAWRNPPYRQAPRVISGHYYWFVFCPPSGSLTPPGAAPVAQCYWFLALKTDPNGP